MRAIAIVNHVKSALHKGTSATFIYCMLSLCALTSFSTRNFPRTKHTHKHTDTREYVIAPEGTFENRVISTERIA